MSSQSDLRKQTGRGTLVRTVDWRTLRQRVWSIAVRKRPVLLWLCLAVLAISNPGGTLSQTQDNARKIVSDDFVKSRRKGIARPATGAGTPRRAVSIA